VCQDCAPDAGGAGVLRQAQERRQVWEKGVLGPRLSPGPGEFRVEEVGAAPRVPFGREGFGHQRGEALMAGVLVSAACRRARAAGFCSSRRSTGGKIAVIPGQQVLPGGVGPLHPGPEAVLWRRRLACDPYL